ncbi:hypothetical protein [Cellvibrio sp. UBA7671]|jgi:hypothetical protein|uniref:hypothetical protein n=1 Tax=Cellvibrio sp. UBA7671 TaxID=1946312 RepID=UPI002F35F587
MKPTDNVTNKSANYVANNPYHVIQPDLPFSQEETGAFGALKHEVDDLVKLELTAEQMVGEEVDLAKAYIREDAQGIWSDMKLGLAELELITGDWLLRAADPTRVEWQLNHWWEDEESQFRH